MVKDENKRILILTETAEGKKHDFEIYKDQGIGDGLPDEIDCFVDLGFQGIQSVSPNLKVHIPKKKPRWGALSVEQKQYNRQISRKRIRSEHAIGGIKRYGIVSQVYRNRWEELDDTVMLVASGLWNYYLNTA